MAASKTRSSLDFNDADREKTSNTPLCTTHVESFVQSSGLRHLYCLTLPSLSGTYYFKSRCIELRSCAVSTIRRTIVVNAALYLHVESREAQDKRELTPRRRTIQGQVREQKKASEERRVHASHCKIRSPHGAILL